MAHNEFRIPLFVSQSAFSIHSNYHSSYLGVSLTRRYLIKGGGRIHQADVDTAVGTLFLINDKERGTKDEREEGAKREGRKIYAIFHCQVFVSPSPPPSRADDVRRKAPASSCLYKMHLPPRRRRAKMDLLTNDAALTTFCNYLYLSCIQIRVLLVTSCKTLVAISSNRSSLSDKVVRGITLRHNGTRNIPPSYCNDLPLLAIHRA
ncbi:hypothetical protein J6590_020252 [Homalodisca vitripennis]|nr:hypothetical protein J6590_020252 [Homalodisca vitripennis]